MDGVGTRTVPPAELPTRDPTDPGTGARCAARVRRCSKVFAGVTTVERLPDTGFLCGHDGIHRELGPAVRSQRSWGAEPPRFQLGERFVDVACGPGDVTTSLRGDVGPVGDALGLDDQHRDVGCRPATRRRGRRARRIPGRRRAVLALADGEMDVGRSERMLQGEPGPEGALAESDLTWCASSGHAAVWS